MVNFLPYDLLYSELPPVRCLLYGELPYMVSHSKMCAREDEWDQYDEVKLSMLRIVKMYGGMMYD